MLLAGLVNVVNGALILIVMPPICNFESATGRQAGKRLINVIGEVLLVPQVGIESGSDNPFPNFGTVQGKTVERADAYPQLGGDLLSSEPL